MNLTIDDIRKEWNPDAIYDTTEIKEPVKWQFYFTKLFPEYSFTTCWVGRLVKKEGGWSSRECSRLLFMQRTDERFRKFRIYWDMFTFHFQDGKIQMFIIATISSEIRAKAEEKFSAGDNWLESVYGQPDENKEVTVTLVPRTFEELALVKAREFTYDEMRAIDITGIQKQIDEKMKEIEKLKAQTTV